MTGVRLFLLELAAAVTLAVPLAFGVRAELNLLPPVWHAVFVVFFAFAIAVGVDITSQVIRERRGGAR